MMNAVTAGGHCLDPDTVDDSVFNSDTIKSAVKEGHQRAIVLFYDQMCDCECNKRKEIMLEMATIFTMVNSL